MQFATKLGLVDISNAEVLAAAESIKFDVIGQLQRRISELDGIRARLVDERDGLRDLLRKHNVLLTGVPKMGSPNDYLTPDQKLEQEIA